MVERYILLNETIYDSAFNKITIHVYQHLLYSFNNFNLKFSQPYILQQNKCQW